MNSSNNIITTFSDKKKSQKCDEFFCAGQLM